MKDATVSARVEYTVKNEAEDILQKLGVPVSVVINSLYRQIIYNQGIPFSLTIPKEPKTLDQLSKADLIQSSPTAIINHFVRRGVRLMRFLMK